MARKFLAPFLLVALGGLPLWAQSIESKTGTGVTLNQNSELFARSMNNAGTVTQNNTSKVYLTGDLVNSGTYSSADTAETHFTGSQTQTITSTTTLDFGRFKINNSSTDPSQDVNLCGNADVFKIEVADGHLSISTPLVQVFSTDTGSSDPMVAVKAGTTMTIEASTTVKLSGGKLYVFTTTAPGASGKLEMHGECDHEATIDFRSGATRYATEIQGDFSGSHFKILQGDASGLKFVKVASNNDPRILNFDNGIFDKGLNTGVYVTLSGVNPIRVDTGDPELFKNITFANTDAVATLTNVNSNSTTTLKDASGLNLSYVTFGSWAGAKGGEGFDSEAVGEDKLRWISTPSGLAQTKLDATAIAVGGSTNENGVILKYTTSSSDSNGLQLEVEVKATSALFDETGTQISSTVNAGSVASNNVYGLATATNYHWRARSRMGTWSSQWVSFGANVDGNTDFSVSVTNANPSVPSTVNQYKNDGTTVISAGGDTNETTVKFKGTLTESDGGQTVKMQVEVKAFADSFDGNVSAESSLVSTGTQVTVTVSGLSNGQYKWRYRAVDSVGGASAWTSFPGDSTYDFQVATVLAPPVITTLSHKTKDNTPAVAGTSTASASIEVFANGVSVGTTTANGSGAWSLSTSSLADGDYSITAKQTVTPNTSDFSASIILTIDTVAPAPPAWVTSTPQSGAMLIEWGPSPSSDVYGYHVYYKTDAQGEGSWTKLTTSGPVSASTRKYRATGLTNGTLYNFKVASVDDAENQ